MGLIPSDPYFFRWKHTDELNHIICGPEIGAPRGLSCIRSRRSRGEVQGACTARRGLSWLGMKVKRHDIGNVGG